MSSGTQLTGPPVVVGRIGVECRLVVRARCPRCGAEHSQTVSAADRQLAPDLWYREEDCQGRHYMVHVRVGEVHRREALARRISRQHHLRPRWYE
jgi:hypothetical protein